MSEKKHRRPKTVTEWRLDDDFHGRLDALVTGGRFKSNAELARFVSKKVDYKIDHATISNLRLRKQKKSKLIGPICNVFGWPHPPVASVDVEFAEMTSMMFEISTASTGDRAKVEAYLRSVVASKRLYDATVRKTPDPTSD